MSSTEVEIVIDWGIPDWNSAQAYGDTQEWSTDRWHWEFIRRRDDCRKDFLDRVDEAGFHARQEHELMLRVDASRVRPKSDERGFCVWVDDGVAKYGLQRIPNPAIGEQPAEVLRFGAASVEQWEGTGDGFLTINAPEGTAVVRFQLSMPLPPQRERARKLLEEAQKQRHGKLIQRRSHPEKWFRYLRVIDARAAGATLSEIARSDILGSHLRSSHAGQDGPQVAAQTHKSAQTLMFSWVD